MPSRVASWPCAAWGQKHPLCRFKTGPGICFSVRKDAVGDESFAVLKLADIGDIVGGDRNPMRTKTGELTLYLPASI